MVERPLPDAHEASAERWRDFAERSNEAIDALAGRAQWVHSYVAGDKVFCVFLADELATVIEHAAYAAFPIGSVHEVNTTIDPTTAEVWL
jgi:Protein of unknown function (DUF4242)